MIKANLVVAALFCLLLLSFSFETIAAQEKNGSMISTSKCGDSALETSSCMIDVILTDITATYTEVGGGGITDIKQVATNTYTVSISQEERIDLITYELDINSDGQVTITRRSEDTKTPGH